MHPSSSSPRSQRVGRAKAAARVGNQIPQSQTSQSAYLVRKHGCTWSRNCSRWCVASCRSANKHTLPESRKHRRLRLLPLRFCRLRMCSEESKSRFPWFDALFADNSTRRTVLVLSSPQPVGTMMLHTLVNWLVAWSLKGRKHWALRPQKPLRLIRDGEVGGSGILYLTPTRYTVTTRMILH